MSSFRVGAGRILVAIILTLAMPVQWGAFCAGWQSPQEAMACCHRAGHDAGASPALSCCTAQEQSRNAQSPVPVGVAIQLVPSHAPVPVATHARLLLESPRAERAVHPRLLASVFLI